ncbi:hypothetical protein QFZ83_001599 [Variovorax sp. W1I1]|uniref:hypothetical protein n=1 Tax=Variovorax sp. W1I1 TaxID=3042309 RepID=UPI00277D543D|nr:hypothetical protein [Variovorax sp. W1I1]MDQ0607428.1 hypothetical protein [Variovorax sp. W1I1]
MTKPRKPGVPTSPQEVQAPLGGANATQKAPAKKEGPTATRTTREGASVGKAGNSTAGGAADQLTPKD